MTGIVVGLAVMIASEAATLAGVEPFASWNTPICWTGFILFADALVRRRRGDSWLTSAPREFALVAAVSIPLWLVFEFYNLFLDNWHYTGLPDNTALRYFGYAWSFATIWPAMFEAAELVAVLRGDRHSPLLARRQAPSAPPAPSAPSAPSALSAPVWFSLALGLLMLVSPLVVSPAVARYLAAPVWIGFILLLDPINARLGGESLIGDFRAGRHDRLVNLLLGGLLCGVLWEFWNYWSRAKWHYTVPIMERVKIFEMPLPGYLGFPAFALECFTMYVFVRLVAGWLVGRRPGAPAGRTIAL